MTVGEYPPFEGGGGGGRGGLGGGGTSLRIIACWNFMTSIRVSGSSLISSCEIPDVFKDAAHSAGSPLRIKNN